MAVGDVGATCWRRAQCAVRWRRALSRPLPKTLLASSQSWTRQSRSPACCNAMPALRRHGSRAIESVSTSLMQSLASELLLHARLASVFIRQLTRLEKVSVASQQEVSSPSSRNCQFQGPVAGEKALKALLCSVVFP